MSEVHGALTGPTDLGGIVDAVIALYRRRPGLILGVSAVLQVPAALVTAFMAAPLPGRIVDLLGFDPFDPNLKTLPTDIPVPSTADLLSLAGPLALIALIGLVTGWLTTAALGLAVGRLGMGEALTVGRTYAGLWHGLGRLLITMAVYLAAMVALWAVAILAGALPFVISPSAVSGGLFAFAGILAFAAVLVASIFISIRWTFWPQVVLLEGAAGIAALARSWRLVAGSTWRVVGYTLLFTLVAGVLSGVLVQLGGVLVDLIANDAQGAMDTLLSFLVRIVATIMLTPVVPAALTWLYLDLRLRRGERPSSPEGPRTSSRI